MTLAQAVDKGDSECSDASPSTQGFTYVARRNDARARKNRKGRAQAGTGQTLDTEAQVQKRKGIVLARKRELEDDGAIRKLLDDVFPSKTNSTVHAALALGVGSVKDARSAQVQLAFLLLVCERLSITDVHFYDPICDDSDHALLQALSIVPLGTNKQGRHALQHNTLVFMPHCTRALYENMLRANWSAERLSRLLLCCNTLNRYVGGGSASARATDVDAPCMQRAVDRDIIHVRPVETDVAQSALNDLAMQAFVPFSHFVSSASATETSYDCTLKDMDAAFWRLPDEAETVQDVELI